MPGFRRDDRVTLLDDLPAHGLRRGQVGRVRAVLAPDLLTVAFTAADGGQQIILPVPAERVALVAPDPPRLAGWSRTALAGRRYARLVLLLIALLGAAATGSSPHRTPLVAPGVALYLVPDERIIYPTDARRLVALDPLTLADHTTGGGITDLIPYFYLYGVSADGATWAGIERPPGGLSSDDAEATVVVRDGPFGPVRTRIRAPGPVGRLLLSQDGTRLVLLPRDQQRHGEPRWDEWWVVDTGSGALLATTKAAPAAGFVTQAWLDPGLWRLYRLEVPGWTQDWTGDPYGTAETATQPHPLRLLVFDLWIGLELGRLELPAVRGGGWQTGRIVHGRPVQATQWPGGAPTPDGRRLILVHADAPAMTVVDLERLAVERTAALVTAPGLPDPLPTRLERVPEAADGGRDSPLVEAAWREVALAPDGRQLYVAGAGFTIDEQGVRFVRSQGLWRVDLEQDRIGAVRPPDLALMRQLSAPVGGDLYVTGWTAWPHDDPQPPPPLRLWRLDPASLTVLAEREVPGTWDLQLWPAATGRAVPPAPTAEERQAQAAILDELGGWVLGPVQPPDGVIVPGTPAPDDGRPGVDVAPAFGLGRPADSVIVRALVVADGRATLVADLHGQAGTVTVRVRAERRVDRWTITRVEPGR